ncbi:hypothetical protein KP509_33G020800 [Ceratopteris richardii]|uniref:Uncharacterized protein n=1 Tax=Ceratopteris richardii TaxID=49495 RepID=A0A8T2QPJ5_CERRI|nr:hypothetical protein KP509_33G020800 [Ceratopteris richardii]
MHRVGSTDDSNHYSTVNCLSLYSDPAHVTEVKDVLFTGSRDGTLKRWELTDAATTCCATFESHTDWVNDALLIGDVLVSCSSDSTIKTWKAFSDGVCTKTFRQHSDYVLSLAIAKKTNAIASGGLGGEVFVWDLEAANVPMVKFSDNGVDSVEPVNNTGHGGGFDNNSTCSDPTSNAEEPQGFMPITVKGHKESVYAVAMNDVGTVLVSGGTEKALRVWDPRTGTKSMKLRGHSDNIRALALDESGRKCLSGSSDSIIRLWDLGQQRCVHSYAVHTDSVWALAANSSFTCVYSGGRDASVCATNLNSRESSLVCSGKHPVLSLAPNGDNWLWVASSECAVQKWSIKSKAQKSSSFLAGSVPCTRATMCTEGSPLIPISTEPACVIPVNPQIVRHTVLNDRRHILTKDMAGVVKLWEITKGEMKVNYGDISFEDKEKELFEMVSVPAWFTADSRLGCLSIHLDSPQCFAAEMYAADAQVPGASEELKINLGHETLRGLFSHWLACREKKTESSPDGNEDTQNNCNIGEEKVMASNSPVKGRSSLPVCSAFDFSSAYPPSIITEGSEGGTWRRKIIDLSGTEDEKELPAWCLDALLHGKFSTKESTKCSFHLHPYEGTTVQVQTQGKLTAPRVLRIHKVITYVHERIVLDKLLVDSNTDSLGTSASNNFQPETLNVKDSRPSTRYWHEKTGFNIDILCNNQVLRPDMTLATVRQYIWKKSDDLQLHFRITLEEK